MRSALKWLRDGVDLSVPGEKLVLSAGAGISLTLALQAIASVGADGRAEGFLLLSLGATALLLFAAPHSPLAQPWNLLAGQVLAVLAGVLARELVTDPLIAAGIAMAALMFAMLLLRCVHPPGGATALFVVFAEGEASAMGLALILHPVLSSALILMLGAMVFTWPFAWRRYPARLARGQ